METTLKRPARMRTRARPPWTKHIAQRRMTLRRRQQTPPHLRMEVETKSWRITSEKNRIVTTEIATAGGTVTEKETAIGTTATATGMETSEDETIEIGTEIALEIETEIETEIEIGIETDRGIETETGDTPPVDHAPEIVVRTHL